MSASYPSNVKAFSPKVNYTQDIDASHVNDLQDEVAAIETYLGVNPHIYGLTNYGTVKDRLVAIQDLLGTDPSGAFDSVDLRLTAIDGGWTSWTPTWTAASSNPVLGNGTIVGAYKQIGDLIIARFKLTIGSSTTKGSGNWRFSYPVAPNSQVVGSSIGSIISRDASGSQSYACMPYAASTSYFTAALGQTLKITNGQETLTFSSDSDKTKNNINYGVTYKYAPVVSTSCGQNGLYSQWENVNESNFDGSLHVGDGGTVSGDKTLKWRAIGMVESNADPSTPFSWATGDILAGVLVYEAA